MHEQISAVLHTISIHLDTISARAEDLLIFAVVFCLKLCTTKALAYNASISYNLPDQS